MLTAMTNLQEGAIMIISILICFGIMLHASGKYDKAKEALEEAKEERRDSHKKLNKAIAIRDQANQIHYRAIAAFENRITTKG